MVDTPQNIKNIEEFEKTLERNANNILCFAGAGTSTFTGLDLWEDLLEKIAEFLTPNIKFKDLIESGVTLPEIASRIYYECEDKNEFYRILIEIIEGRKMGSYELSNSILGVFDFIVTTNFDDSLQKGFDQLILILNNYSHTHISLKTYQLPKFDLDETNSKKLIYLHGKYNSRDIIIREEDYQKYYPSYYLPQTFDSSQEVENMLENLLKKYCFIFIGFSFNDAVFNSIFSNNVIKNKPDELTKFEPPTHFAFLSTDAIRDYIIPHEDFPTMSRNFLTENNIIRKRQSDGEYIFTNIYKRLDELKLKLTPDQLNDIIKIKKKLENNLNRLNFIVKHKIVPLLFKGDDYRRIVIFLDKYITKPTNTQTMAQIQ